METSPLTAPTAYAGRHRLEDHLAPRVAGYEVLGPLARGGSGTVWAATDASGQPVAIKVVPAADADDALVELAVLGRIADPHLVRLHEAVALPSGDVALVMDHLTGGTVGAVVRARGHLAAGEVVTALVPIASTLARLHAVGVVHGDVSPDNVLLDGGGRPYLADLGVARIVGERLSEVRGTEGFVAPEVALGASPTAASDVHAVGALAWFCLTGSVPDPAAVRGRLAERVPGLPGALVTTVEGALRLDPADRPGADELALALYESVEALPLPLTQGRDDVSLLTRRIRAAARAAPAPPSGGHRRRLWVRSLVSRVRAFRRPGRLSSGLVLAVSCAALLVVLAADRAVWWAHAPGSGAQGQASPAPPRPPGDLRMLADAPERDPLGLVRALAAARARAWETGIAARLVEVDAPGSPALARDTEVLAGVQRAQQRYVGLTFDVREAVVSRRGDGVASIRTRIDTGAHLVRSPRGEEPRPATSDAAVILDLVHTPTGWRVHEVRELP
ncbi:protein kinase domain-containing protein [Knoellia sp. CPCC 206435]|uniref:serine/threonine-protein kinase n=1 Tax=Knoellia terrae TaxID=3404797 RepID=UPI003B428E35